MEEPPFFPALRQLIPDPAVFESVLALFNKNIGVFQGIIEGCDRPVLILSSSSNNQPTLFYANPAYRNLSVGATLSKDAPFEPFSPQDQKKLIRSFDLIRKGNALDASFELTPSQTNTTLLVKAHAVTVPGQAETFVVFDFQDITEERHTTNALQQAHSRANRLSNITSEGLVIHENGIITDVNAAFQMLLGLNADMLIGLSLHEIVDKSYQQALNQLIEQPNEFIRELKLITATGQTIPVEAQNKRLRLESTMTDVLIFRDISEQKATLYQLHYQALLLNNLEDAIISVDTDDHIVNWNHVAERLFGYTPQEAIGQKIKTLLKNDYINVDSAHIKAVLNKAGSWHGEVRLTAKSGQVLDVSATISTLKDHLGKTIGSVGILRNITQLKTIEQELRASQQMLRQVIDNLPQFIYWKDKNSVYLGCNRNYAIHRKFPTPDQLIGKTDYDIHEDKAEADFYRGLDQKVILSGSPLFRTLDLAEENTNGRRYFNLIKVPLINNAGEVTGVLSMLEDITERHRAVQELQHSRKLFMDALNALPIMIYLKNQKQQYVFFNTATLQMMNTTAEEVLFKTDYELFSPEQAKHFLEDDDLVLQGLAPNIKEQIIEINNRSMYVLAGKTVVTQDQSGEKLILGFAADITPQKDAQLQLKRKTEELSALLSALPDIYFRFDLEGRYLDFAGNEEYLLVKPEELLGRTISELMPAEIAVPALEKIKAAYTTGERQTFEYELEINQEKRAYESRFLPPMDETKEVICIVRDVTDSRKSREQLQRSEAQYRAVVEDQTELILRFYVPANQFTFINEAFTTRFGLTLYTLNNNRTAALENIPDSDIKRLRRELRHLGPHHPVTSFTHRIIDKSGEVRWLQWTIRSWFDELGTLTEVQAVGRDVSRLKLTEQALRESQERYRSVIDTVKEVLFQTDDQGNLTFLNAYWEEVSGYSRVESLGRPLSTFIHHEDRLQFERFFKALISEYQTPPTMEFRMINKHEQVLWVEINFRLSLAEAGDIVGTSGRLDDISDRKRASEAMRIAAETAEAASRAKSDFMAVFSHEIRTPMNGVVGMTRLLLNSALDNEQREYVETIQVCSNTLLAIVNDLLNFTKLESGKVELEILPFDLNTCIEEVFDLLSPHALSKNIELTYNLAPEVPACIYSDITRIRQVLINLVGNALKFTERGEVELQVHVIQQPQDFPTGITLQFSVRDTGIGIPADKLKKLFVPFSQIDATMTRRYGGTGLGLVISARFIELLNGQIGVQSTAGEGSTFYFTLPTTPAPVPLAQQTAYQALAGKTIGVYGGNHTLAQNILKMTKNVGMQGYIQPLTVDDQPTNGTIPALDVLIYIPERGQPLQDPEQLKRHFGLRSSKQLILLVPPGQAPADKNQDMTVLHKPLKFSQLYQALNRIFDTQPVHKIEPFRNHTQYQLDKGLAEKYPLRILVAEDNPLNQKLMTKVLEKLGFVPIIANNGIEALDKLNRTPIDLIFMDIQMPDLDGLETARLIHKNFPPENKPLIIAMTANVMPGDRDLCLQAGMIDYISKPIRLDEVQTKIIKYGKLRFEQNPI